jgi:hypothetical protein
MLEGESSRARVRSLAAVEVDLGEIALAAGQDEEADVRTRAADPDRPRGGSPPRPWAAVMRFGSRVASEGGGDVDAGWARPG